MAIETIKEGETFWLTVDFADRAGDPEVPTAVEYRVHNPDTGTAFVATTSITPAASVEIELNSVVNALETPGSRLERRVVTVVAGYGSNNELPRQYVYHIEPLEYVPDV